MSVINKRTEKTFVPKTGKKAIPAYKDYVDEIVDFINDTNSSTGDVKSDTISEYTSGSGVTISNSVIFGASETIAAGGTSTALDLTKTVHLVDADAGGDIFTLADGTAGQIMTIAMASSTGTATVTPANLAGGTSVTFNAAGDSVVLQFIGSSWYILGGNSYAVI